MTNPQNDIPNSKPASKNTMYKANIYEDEIDLIDYLNILWKRKYFIVLSSVLPTLLLGLILFFSPIDYRATFTYDIVPKKTDYKKLLEKFSSAENWDELTAKLEEDKFSERDRRILLDRFYSAENLGILAAKLEENGFNEYAQGISKAKIQLEISDTFLTMTVIGRSQEDMQRISSIVRNNFERVLPVSSVKQELNSDIARLKIDMVAIEENKFNLELELERKRSTLTKLKDLEPVDSNRIPGGIILHFDNVSENSEYLPIAYQIQATDANIINIEETIKANQRKYKYYKDLLSLNEKLFDEVKDKTSSFYDIWEFHSFLTRMASDCKDEELIHYLNAYMKKIENAIFANTPIVEKPMIYSVPKGSLRKTGIAFVALLMITTFGAFLLEAVQKSRKPGSVKASGSDGQTR